MPERSSMGYVSPKHRTANMQQAHRGGRMHPGHLQVNSSHSNSTHQVFLKNMISYLFIFPLITQFSISEFSILHSYTLSLFISI